MLQQPTKEKLYALRLHGMIEAIERQEQDEAAENWASWIVWLC